MLLRQRLFFEDIQYGGSKFAFVQRLENRRFIYSIAAPHVDKDGMRGQVVEHCLINNPIGSFGSRQNTDQIIQSRHEFYKTIFTERGMKISIHLPAFFAFPGKASDLHSKMFSSPGKMRP